MIFRNLLFTIKISKPFNGKISQGGPTTGCHSMNLVLVVMSYNGRRFSITTLKKTEGLLFLSKLVFIWLDLITNLSDKKYLLSVTIIHKACKKALYRCKLFYHLEVLIDTSCISFLEYIVFVLTNVISVVFEWVNLKTCVIDSDRISAFWQTTVANALDPPFDI